MATAEQPATRRQAVRARVVAVDGGTATSRADLLAAEEPLEIRAAGPGQQPVSVAVTMRTPGNDMELAAGFLFTEGLVEGREEIAQIRYCGLEVEQDQRFNIVTVHLRRAFDGSSLQRNFFATSSCGICGKASIEQLTVRCERVPAGPPIASEVVARLPTALRRSQAVFEETGGLHAAGLFTPDGELTVLREDVGRHNAMDKLVGHELLEGRLPAHDRLALVSGRLSFELVQKAAVAGIPIVCAVSAPSTLAVATARELGMTLVGFLRDGRYNIYAGDERVTV